MIKSTFLDLKTINEKPTIHDLPVSPLFGSVTAPCTESSRSQDDKNYFTVSRRSYDPFAGTYTTMDIPCTYDPENGRHSSVANATNGKAIFSVAGEVFLGRKLVQIIANEIEWTYPSIEKKNGNDEAKSPRKKLKSKHLDFEEKIISSSSNKRRSVNYIDKEWNRKRRSTDHDVQEESSTSRSAKLENAVNVVVGDRNDKGKGRADDAMIENIDNDEDENEIEMNSKNYESCDTE